MVTVAVGVASPAIMWLAFLPMLCIAIAYYYMNRADPDCGTSFTWVARGMGPHLGWMTGWAIIVADIIVMASLAEVAAQYTFSLFGVDWANNPVLPVEIAGQTLDFGEIGLGVLFIAILTRASRRRPMPRSGWASSRSSGTWPSRSSPRTCTTT